MDDVRAVPLELTILMPYRYLGNPVLTAIGSLLYGSPSATLIMLAVSTASMSFFLRLTRRAG